MMVFVFVCDAMAGWACANTWVIGSIDVSQCSGMEIKPADRSCVHICISSVRLTSRLSSLRAECIDIN